MDKRRIDPATERLVCEMYERGDSLRDIQQTAGVGYSTVYDIINRHGFVSRRKQKRQETERRYLTICEMYQDGITMREIEAELGVTRATVLRALKWGEGQEAFKKRHKPRASSKRRDCVRCNEYPAHGHYALCVRCRAVAAIKREQAVRRMQRERMA